MTLTLSALAKVNLRLRIGDRRPDGYHPIETLFCALDLADELVVEWTPDRTVPTLRAEAAPPLRALPDMGPDHFNLAVRAAVAFTRAAGLSPGLEIRLKKCIPAGAGLGGGSSDAGAMLRGLAGLDPAALPPEDVLEIAASLGSDVPFFASGAPLAIGRGRGEKLSALPPLPSRPVVLALPPLHLSTAAAYSALDRARGAGETRAGCAARGGGAEDASVAPSREASWEDVAREAVNDFEPVLFRLHPILASLRDDLRAAGAAIALLAGSGSTVFGVFAAEDAARAAADRLSATHPGVDVVLTRTRTAIS